jgi:hypothetical protein
MANFPTYTDTISMTRPPKMGDIRKRTDYNNWIDVVEIFDGTNWQQIQDDVSKTTNGNFTITGIPAPAGSYAAVSTAASYDREEYPSCRNL